MYTQSRIPHFVCLCVYVSVSVTITVLRLCLLLCCASAGVCVCVCVSLRVPITELVMCLLLCCVCGYYCVAPVRVSVSGCAPAFVSALTSASVSMFGRPPSFVAISVCIVCVCVCLYFPVSDCVSICLCLYPRARLHHCTRDVCACPSTLVAVSF